MTAIIEAKDLSKWFGEVVAVNNLQIEIGAGVTGLLGPNGAGKSTFMRLALGLYAPSRGYIHVFGESPRNNLDVLRRFGYCPEGEQFYEMMSGFEYVNWMNRFWGMDAPSAERRAEESLERVKMTSRMDDLISSYSRGMRQRIKIAAAISPDPDLLFLDEPLTGLDPEAREEMFELIRALADAGKAIIMSTHILYEVQRVTSNVVLLRNGSILARGKVQDIRELIDEHPHAVTIACDNPRRLAERFIVDASTLNIEFDKGKVTVRTRDPNGFYDRLNGMVIDGEIKASSITCPDDNLQSVFDYLIE
jgi:ABC-2 type transport system ATP-binding protein